MDEVIQKKLEDFFQQFRHVQYKKGTVLIRTGENPSSVFYLKEGLVKQYAISVKGEELMVNMFKEQSFFPMSWAINQTPNNFFFEALTDIQAICAPRVAVVKFIKENPDVLYDLLARVYKGVDGILLKMVYLMAGNAYSRLIVEIIILAKRIGVQKNTSAELTVSEKDLASQTGMTRETVSREIKILKDKGLVSYEKNKFIIPDLKKLENELGDNL